MLAIPVERVASTGLAAAENWASARPSARPNWWALSSKGVENPIRARNLCIGASDITGKDVLYCQSG